MKFRKILSVCLAAVLVLGLLPVSAQAASTLDLIKKYGGTSSSSSDSIFGGTTGGCGILMEDPCYQEGGKVFGSSIKRSKVQSVTFLDTVSKAPSDWWDVSEDQDGSVKAWVEKDGSKYDLYIAAIGGVDAPENCSGMFYGYTAMEEIDFDGNFNTEEATTMSYMFTACKALEEIDCSDFDTSNVTKMECMFMYCEELEDVDVSSFDTSKVWDMGSMFWGCKSLCYIDISNFDYSRVSNGGYMFEQCAPGIKVLW